MVRRPEHSAPPDIFYNEREVQKYVQSTRLSLVQAKMTLRALELLGLPPDSRDLLLLDIGCGTALSGEVIEKHHHKWLGMDISLDMLKGAYARGAGDCVVHHDMGTWNPFRPATFDGAVSISAVQWLCNADRREHIPQKRLKVFFTSLFTVLRRGARAVLQFYPENVHQTDMITRAAMMAGFGGGLVVDYPNSTRARKTYLVLSTVSGSATALPPARGIGRMDVAEAFGESSTTDGDSDSDEVSEDEDSEATDGRTGTVATTCQTGSNEHSRKRKVSLSERGKRGKRARLTNKSGRPKAGTKEWIALKKEQRRNRGDETRPDSKYTGRRRRRKF